MRLIARIALLVLFFLPEGLFGAEDLDLKVLSQIRQEGTRNSKAEETLIYLTDVIGPRLTGSPGLERSGKWIQSRLTEWGLTNVQLEPWEEFGRGWDYTLCRVEMVKPYYSPLIAYPLAWTRSLEGPLQGKPVMAEINSEADFERYRGKLKGAIVMMGELRWDGPGFEPDASRLSDEELKGLESAMEGERRFEDGRRIDFRARRELRNKIRKFLEDEGVVLVVEPGRGTAGTVFVGNGGSHRKNEAIGLPGVAMAAEHYGRLARSLKLEQEVEIRVELRSQVYEDQEKQFNVVGEIEGADPSLKDQLVLVGGHLDSTHAGTGATDNAAGCVVAMETVRMIKTLGLKPRRTVRIALWTGEEQGLLGSAAYVKAHYGDASTGETLPDHGKVSGYFNYDNGTGRIRGIYLQGNDAVRPVFESYIEPIRDLGVTTLTIRNTRGTDHLSFDAVGIPGFQFIQDPVAYDSRTHHSNMDVFEQLVLDDIRQSSVVMTWFVYNTAMRDEMLPRKAMPKPEERRGERQRGR